MLLPIPQSQSFATLYTPSVHHTLVPWTFPAPAPTLEAPLVRLRVEKWGWKGSTALVRVMVHATQQLLQWNLVTGDATLRAAALHVVSGSLRLSASRGETCLVLTDVYMTLQMSILKYLTEVMVPQRQSHELTERFRRHIFRVAHAAQDAVQMMRLLL